MAVIKAGMKAIVVALALCAGPLYAMALREALPPVTVTGSRPFDVAQWFSGRCSTCLKPGAESCNVSMQACEMSCTAGSCREACTKQFDACHQRNRSICSADCR